MSCRYWKINPTNQWTEKTSENSERFYKARVRCRWVWYYGRIQFRWRKKMAGYSHCYTFCH